jgi:predicted O-linked N-acetylglucosamine transferase (SPINDLY family)
MTGNSAATLPELLSRACHCLQEGRLTEAEEMYRALLDRFSHLAEAHFQLGLTLSTQGRREEAISCYERALVIRPDYIEAHYRLGNALAHLCRFDAAISSYERALALKPDYAPAHDTLLFALLYSSARSIQEICSAHTRYAEQCERPLMPLWPRHANTRDPGRRLKVGYVSPDFREHPVTSFIAPILGHHAASQIESYAYYNHTWQDAATARIRAAADHWVPCSMLSDEQLAERIRADGIDILVDLAGHTVGNRLLVFARKPAPVQVSYLGYPATTGLKAMDWRLVTTETDPEGAEQWHSERLYRLPRSLWCYRPPDTEEVSTETPARTAGHITFGSMNNIAKVSDATVRVVGNTQAGAGIAAGADERRRRDRR